MNDDKLLIAIAKKIYPGNFNEECTERLNGKTFKYVDRLHMEVKHRPPVRHVFANYTVRTHYRDKFYQYIDRRRGDKEWMSNPTDEKKYIETEILRIVRRGCPMVSIDTLTFGMVNYFKANVLLLEDYKMFNLHHKTMKLLMETKGICLLFETEVKF